MRLAKRLGCYAAGLVLAASTALVVACGGGGGGGGGTTGPVVTASFLGSGAVASANHVRLTSPSTSGDQVVVEVKIAGLTTSTDLYSFAFDLLLSDPTVATYVNGSAQFGDALTLVGLQTGGVQASQSGNRVVVGVTKVSGGGGNQVPAGEKVVVRLTFRVLKVGTTLVGFSGRVSVGNPTGGPAALDSTGTIIPTVQFDNGNAELNGT